MVRLIIIFILKTVLPQEVVVKTKENRRLLSLHLEQDMKTIILKMEI